NILTGTVDRTAPRIVGTTSPADSLLSQGDEIAISFDEALDCETFLNGTNVSVKVLADDVHAEVELFKTVDFSYTCSGSGIVITINPAKLQAYDGRRWEVQVRSITDWLGNASDPIAPTWQFQVDYFKQSPSSVTLVGPEDWRINAATAEQTLHFAITDYDVFQASTSLSEIALQYKRDVDADWLTASTLTVAQLEARHRAQGVADEIPIDTLNWDASTVLDGSYTVRAVATGNTGRQSVSGPASGLIDRVAPALLGTPSPQDGVYDSQDDVAFTFTEAIDCEAGYQFNSSVLDYGATSAEELEPTQVVCLGDQVQFIFAEELLKDHFGGTVTIELALVTDLAGNGIEGTGTVTYSFIIGQLGEETSPVALLTPSADWQVNQAQPEVTFTLGGYDLYELHSTLDSLVLEYSAEHESEWHAIESMTQEALANHHVANRATESEEPTYAVTWMPGVADGNYEVRAVAYGAHGFPEYSGAIQGRIDQTSPWLLSMTPENGALQHSQTIALTFTEAIAEASLAGDALSLQEQVLVTPFGGGEPYFSYVKIPEEMYRVAYQGETVAFYFDDQFTVTYDGATLALGVDGITDQNGNVLEDAVTATFAVQNVTPTAQRLESLHLTGEQLEDGSIALTWNAYDALGTEGYTVERSANGQFFETVATLQEALGYQEAVRFEEVIFYRLRLQRNDGTEKYSRVAVIEDQGIALPLAVEVFPNPIEENILRFSWYSKGSEESVTLEVRDVRGVLVHKEELDLTTRGTQISVQLPEHLDPGMYLLNATQGVQSHSMKFFNP
ncbi:MAG TPA: hypothetical protein DCP28_30635, partial [Cytophagales bacterium]|nr:hypothetical protein [Cytophagales bacterium]